jgi:hypothetical protein
MTSSSLLRGSATRRLPPRARVVDPLASVAIDLDGYPALATPAPRALAQLQRATALTSTK